MLHNEEYPCPGQGEEGEGGVPMSWLVGEGGEGGMGIGEESGEGREGYPCPGWGGKGEGRKVKYPCSYQGGREGGYTTPILTRSTPPP